MSRRTTRGNPNFGRTANAPTPAVNLSNPTANAPAPIADIPRTVVAPAAPVEMTKREDFGRDKDLKTLLKHLQPKSFKGEGTDIPKFLE